MHTHRTTDQSFTPARRWLALSAALLPVVLVAGCGNGAQASPTGSKHVLSARPTPTLDQTPTPSTGVATPSATRSADPTTPAGTGSPVVTPTVLPTEAQASGTCRASGLAVGTRDAVGGPAAGSTYLVITFRNTTSTTCTLDGHPGVSFVGHGDGTQIGAPAARTGALRLVRLAADRTTTALLQVADTGDYSAAQCAPTTADGFRIYPPGSRASVFVPRRVAACQKSTGASPQLQVSAVGNTAG